METPGKKDFDSSQMFDVDGRRNRTTTGSGALMNVEIEAGPSAALRVNFLIGTLTIAEDAAKLSQNDVGDSPAGIWAINLGLGGGVVLKVEVGFVKDFDKI